MNIKGSFKKGNKAGKLSKGTSKMPVRDIRTLVREKVDWDKLISILFREACGGHKITNGNGIVSVARPNFDSARLLLSYGFGTPDGMVLQEDTTAALKDFSAFVKGMTTPTAPGTGNSAVSENGSITAESVSVLSNANG